MVAEDDPVQVKFECKEVNPDENNRALHISHHNSGTVIESKKSSINANRKSIVQGFPTSHQPRSCVTPNFPKMGFRYPNLTFFAQALTKNHHKSATKFHCLKTSSNRLVRDQLPIERYQHFARG